MATEITFEVQGMKELQDKLNRAPDTILRISLNEGLRKIDRLFVPAKGTGPLADDTPKRKGRLARSTHFRIAGDPRNQRLEILQPATTASGKFYGPYVREGTKPHEIRPVKGRFLRFVIDGEVIFSTLVHHPGTLANPYHKRTLLRLSGGVQQIANEIGKKVTAYLSGR